MRQWEIFDYLFEDSIGLHPAIILSPDEAASNPDVKMVNLLLVTTVRADYRVGPYDVMLNGADGLDHLSRVRVMPIFRAFKSGLGRKRGTLSSIRQKIVAGKIREVYRLG